MAKKYTWLIAWIVIWNAWTAPDVTAWEEDKPLFFVALTGDAIDGRVPVLLRWFSDRVDLGIDRFRIYRKAGTADSSAPMLPISETQTLRNENLIRSILQRPEHARAFYDLMEILNAIHDEPVDEETYLSQLLRIVDFSDGCDGCAFRRSMLVQANYGVAVVEGLGYVDLVDPGLYTYELRIDSPADGQEIVVGRATVDASIPSRLPAPEQPSSVDVRGERGHLKIFLRWDNGQELDARRMAMFGYNVYRRRGPLNQQSFAELLERDLLERVNDLPILAPSAQGRGDSEEDDYFFMDDGMRLEADGPVGEPFQAGETITYWVVARDLFGRSSHPSESLQVTVQDRRPPRAPRGLQTEILDDGENRRILLSWQRNEDDTVMYQVFRYRDINLIGSLEPLPEINGLPQGFINVVPQEENDRPAFIDMGVQNPQHENLTFWYAIKAVDEFGNVSLFSPPARGVIFDTDAPPGPEPPEICINSLTTLMTDYEVKSFGETFEDIRRIRVQGRIIRASSLLGRMAVDRVVRYRQNGMDFDRDPVRIYSGAFGERDWIEIHDDFNLDEVDSGVYYRITPTLVTGRSGEVTTFPDTLQQESEMREIYIKGQGIDMTLEFDVEESRNCFEPDPSVTLEHIPRNGSGEIEPLVFLINQGDADQAEVILYRAEDCENYHIVSRESFDENGQASVEDDFAPDQGGRVCYAIRTVDENGNLSELEYIVASVVFTPLIDSNVIPPTLLGADRTGDEARPGVMLRWLSPDRNVTAFRVYFGNSQDASENDMSVYLDRDSYLLDEAIQTCTTALFSIDDRNGEPLAPDRPYWIHIEAIQQDGTGVMSLNGLRFVWNAVSVEGNYPGWPSRDPAPVIQGTQAEWLPNLLEIPTAFSQGIGVEIGRGKFDSRDRIILESSIIENPFIVYRKRLDKPERKFIQISGLVENIVISEDGTTINTPFVTIRIVPDQGKEQILDIKMYFLDTVNLIERAQYAYKIVELDKETGEIISERSQTNAVEVPR